MKINRKQLRRIILSEMQIFSEEWHPSSPSADTEEGPELYEGGLTLFEAISAYIVDFWTGVSTNGAFDRKKVFRPFKGKFNDDEEGAVTEYRAFMDKKFAEMRRPYYKLTGGSEMGYGSLMTKDEIDEIDRVLGRTSDEIVSIRSNRVSWQSPNGRTRYTIPGKHFDF